PMLATGGSGSAACTAVKEAGRAESIRFVCVVSAPEGIRKMQDDHPDIPIFTAAVDRQLNEHGYILPGLGDFGDRLFGTEEARGGPARDRGSPSPKTVQGEGGPKDPHPRGFALT